MTVEAQIARCEREIQELDKLWPDDLCYQYVVGWHDWYAEIIRLTRLAEQTTSNEKE